MMISVRKGPQERRCGTKRRNKEKSTTQEENCNKHDMHSTNECPGTAMCQAASEFIPRGVLNHCMLSGAHNLLNGMPSNILGKSALAFIKDWDLWLALRAMVVVGEQDALEL